MRKSDRFFIYLLLNGFILLFLFAHAIHQKGAAISLLREKSDMVRQLELTDLCLFTEASYTRHLTQADLHTPFQDHPLSLEHFPSGSLHFPPLMIKKLNGHLD